MASSSTLFWSAVVSAIAAVGLAVSLRLQQPLLPYSGSDSSSIGGASTYCYKGVKTNDHSTPLAHCFSTQNGLFDRVWTGYNRLPVGALVTEQSDGCAIPGLWDGHCHLYEYGDFLHSVDLFGSESIEQALENIKEFFGAHPGAGSPDNWIRGAGWDQTPFGRMPTAMKSSRALTSIVDRIDFHCTWVSQAVLDLLPADIPSIPGGDVIRDPGLGVFCDNAMDWVYEKWPKPGKTEMVNRVKTAMSKLNEVGLVGIHEAGRTPEEIRMYAGMADSDDWTLRVYGMLMCDERNSFCPSEALKIERDDHRLIVKSVKLFADGALGSWGSAMIEPYADHTWTSGSLLLNASALVHLATSWASEGYQVNIHAIGDLANRYAIDALEAALRQQCPGESLQDCQAKHRFRLEHAQIIHPDDQARMHTIGLIPSIQPTHATSDMRYAEDRLGPWRTREEAYRMKSVLGLNPVFGSDFPVEPPNPFHGMYAAVTRKSPHTGHGLDPENPDQGWYREEALSLREAFWGFTGGAAHGAFLENKAGVIREGALADWVVFDEPLDGIDIEKLRTLSVRETWVGGRKVYSRGQ